MVDEPSLNPITDELDVDNTTAGVEDPNVIDKVAKAIDEAMNQSKNQNSMSRNGSNNISLFIVGNSLPKSNTSATGSKTNLAPGENNASKPTTATVVNAESNS